MPYSLSDLEHFPADVVVHCGDKTWNLHGAVLATRCEWFRAALLGGFQEGQARTIRIEEFEEKWISFLIEYIYLGGTPEPPYQEGQDLSYFATCMTIFDLADYFLLPELRRQMGARFANDMYLWGCGWHDAWKQQQQTRMDTLFELVRDLYTRDLNSPASKEFRPPVLNHLRGVQTGGEIPTTALIDLIDEFPALGADLFKASLGRAEALLHAEEDFDAEEEM
ncbi:hypothetical protein F5B18DRAFT_605123 [Nemania serpens]|nr:hypothetical protein F5B18DRAFT_605123 [Nemania serpens]